MTKTTRAFLDALSDASGVELDPTTSKARVARLGPVSRIVGATLRNTANPTMLKAGYKATSSRRRRGDGRLSSPAGPEEHFKRQLAEISARASSSSGWSPTTRSNRFEARWSTRWRRRWWPRTRAEPTPVHDVRRNRRQVVRRLGMRCYGFSPLRLPPDLDFAALFHGVDERVPVDALPFGVRVLDRFVAGS